MTSMISRSCHGIKLIHYLLKLLSHEGLFWIFGQLERYGPVESDKIFWTNINWFKMAKWKIMLLLNLWVALIVELCYCIIHSCDESGQLNGFVDKIMGHLKAIILKIFRQTIVSTRTPVLLFALYGQHHL
jgi:hypothetical protein